MNLQDDRKTIERRRVVKTVAQGFTRGFMHGFGGPACIGATSIAEPVYRSSGVAGDWRKVGNDIRSSLVKHRPKK